MTRRSPPAAAERAAPRPTFLLPWLLGCALAAVSQRAQAHSFDPALLRLRETSAGRFDVLWKLPGRESGSFPAGGIVPEPRFPQHCRALDAPGLVPVVAATADTGPTPSRLDCGRGGLHGERIAVSGLGGSRLDVLVQIDWQDGTSNSTVLHGGASEFQVPPSPASRGVGSGAPIGTVVGAYVRLGIGHIAAGYDHLAFVLALFLLVESRRMLVKTISTFTLAHSVTLAFAAVGVVHVPAAPVEALIAASIVLVAREVVRPDGFAASLAGRRPWVPALVFGLLHGLGFAGALSEFGLPGDAVLPALAGFNVGVEIGQLAFAGALALAAALVARLPLDAVRARAVCARALGVVASAWTIERIAAFWS